jgi:hypothetical protein
MYQEKEIFCAWISHRYISALNLLYPPSHLYLFMNSVFQLCPYPPTLKLKLAAENYPHCFLFHTTLISQQVVCVIKASLG